MDSANASINPNEKSEDVEDKFDGMQYNCRQKSEVISQKIEISTNPNITNIIYHRTYQPN